ncbi:MAG: M48 family metalloprotease [Myxococcaceae bacterium]
MASTRSVFALVLLALAVDSGAAEPAPGPAFDVEAATEAYLARLSPATRARSDSYYQGGYLWEVLDVLLLVGVCLLFLQTGLSGRLRDWAERQTDRRALQTVLYWAAYFPLSSALLFPFTLYEGFFREHAYGLSNQTLGSWLLDRTKLFGLLLLLGGALLVVLYALVQRLPRSWWAWGAVVTTLFATLSLVVFPIFVAPLFNHYTRLTDERVRAPILRMAAANGLAAEEVWVSDASRHSKRISANVSGLLGTERITLNDNLLRRGTPEQVQAVMGHELGHYVLNHGYKLLAFFALLALAVFAALRTLFSWALARWGSLWGVRGVGDPAGLPLFVLLGSVLGLLLTPVGNTLQRVQEQEADVFGLNAARQPDAFAEVALQLSDYRMVAPGPVEEFIFFDHPSARTRIRTAMRWKAAQPPP